jgi:hypothetical protein
MPGVGGTALSPELQLALGPEVGHWRLPTGSDRRIGSSVGTTCLIGEPSGMAAGAAKAGVAGPSWLDTATTATKAIMAWST